MDSGFLKLILAGLLCLPVVAACCVIFVRVCKDDKEADYTVFESPRGKGSKTMRRKAKDENKKLMQDMSVFDDEFFKDE